MLLPSVDDCRVAGGKCDALLLSRHGERRDLTWRDAVVDVVINALSSRGRLRVS